MGRFQMVNNEIKEKTKDLNLNSSEHREIMHLALLAQISETLGLFLDIYASTHGVHLETPEVEKPKKDLKKMAKAMKKDDERIPDSEIPFASDE